ncbi:ABC transporter ATP-binding protein [Leptospira sp. 96542]|nr:ABC transporter ATP-binding protein [Leptospira sp. 96542]
MEFVTLENVSKFYHGFSKPWRRLLTGVTFGYFGINVKFRALNRLNLKVKSKEILGIIGRNGAGKSTLLKLITGVISKDQGNLIVNGSVRALLELSVGFNSELSGEENVFYNGLVWGYKPNEIKLLMDEIFKFADLESFRSTPLKNYSSGMAMRLGFSLATAKRPDILIVDEALAVGDASFQQKCLKRIAEFKEQGSAILVVSHDLGLISHFCTRVILLEKGEICFDGLPKETIEAYMLLLADPESKEKTINSDVFDTLEVYFETIGLQTTKHLFVGETYQLVISFSPKIVLESVTIGFHIDDEKGIRIFGTNSNLLGAQPIDLQPNEKLEAKFQFPIRFKEGKYSLGFSIHKGESHLEGSYFWSESHINFEVERGDLPKFVGIVHTPTTVSFQKGMV